MNFVKRFLVILGLLYLPAIYIIAAMALPHRLPVSAGAIALAPYILGLVLLVFAMRKGRRA